MESRLSALLCSTVSVCACGRMSKAILCTYWQSAINYSRKWKQQWNVVMVAASVRRSVSRCHYPLTTELRFRFVWNMNDFRFPWHTRGRPANCGRMALFIDIDYLVSPPLDPSRFELTLILNRIHSRLQCNESNYEPMCGECVCAHSG